MDNISNRIINEVRGVNRVCYDISSKPPSTIGMYNFYHPIIKKMKRKLIRHVLRRFANIFFKINTNVGREIYFKETPKNQLLITKTSENLYYIINSSDKVISKSIYCNKKSFDAHHLTNALNLIPCSKSILLDVGANIGTIGIFGISKGYFDKCIAFEPDRIILNF